MFSSTAGYGHVLPMLPVAEAALGREHEVLWATAAEVCPRIEASGVDTVPVGMTAGQCLREYARRWPEATRLEVAAAAAHMFPRLFGVVAAQAAVVDLFRAARDWKPDLIVHEAADFAAPAVAEALGVPHVTHSLGLVIPPERVADAGELAAPIWERLGLEARPFGGCYDHAYIDICPPSMQRDEITYVSRTIRARPASLRAVPGERLPDPLSERLAVDPSLPVVHVTFGTVFDHSATIERTVRALARLNALIVLTVPPDVDIEGLGPLARNVHAARFISYNVLLPHCAAVASHAGAGVMFATLARGLPQLCLPQSPSDQFRNAAACAGAGAGLALVGDEASESAIQGSAQRLLDDYTFRANAERISRDIKSMPPPEDAVAELEQLV